MNAIRQRGADLHKLHEKEKPSEDCVSIQAPWWQ